MSQVMMETSSFQQLKLNIVDFVGLSKDAIHIHLGLAVFFIVALTFRKDVSTRAPIVSVLVFSVLLEIADALDDVGSFGYWRWEASVHDIINTMLEPLVIYLLAKSSRLFRSIGLWTRVNREG